MDDPSSWDRDLIIEQNTEMPSTRFTDSWVSRIFNAWMGRLWILIGPPIK